MKKVLISILIALLALSGCKKEIINLNTDPTPHGILSIKTNGNIGSHYQYRVYCINNPADYFRIDSSTAPSFLISGIVKDTDNYINLKMTRSEFFYIVAYRDTILHTDSFYFNNANGQGYSSFTTAIKTVIVNRSVTEGIGLPVTQF